jgi:hypothetical protein
MFHLQKWISIKFDVERLHQNVSGGYSYGRYTQRISSFHIQASTGLEYLDRLSDYQRLKKDLPNNLAQAITFLSCIREAPCSKLGRDFDYPDWGFHGFPQSLHTNARIVPQIRPRPLPFIPICFINLLQNSHRWYINYNQLIVFIFLKSPYLSIA